MGPISGHPQPKDRVQVGGTSQEAVPQAAVKLPIQAGTNEPPMACVELHPEEIKSPPPNQSCFAWQVCHARCVRRVEQAGRKQRQEPVVMPKGLSRDTQVGNKVTVQVCGEEVK